MNKRALLIALVASMVGVVLILLYVRKFEQQVSGGKRIELLVAIKPLDRGAVITNDVLAVREVPLAYVEDRAVKASERPKIVGLRVGTSIQPQQTLMWTDMAIATDERRDLSSLVQPGSRAVSVPARGGDKSFALLRPGDYVDVVAIMPEAESGKKKSAVVLLQKVLVLAVGLDTAAELMTAPAERGRARRPEMILTLSLHLQEAQLIALALEKGHITVALRNPDDQRVAEGIPDMSSSALMDTKVRRAAARKNPGKPIRLEAGGKR